MTNIHDDEYYNVVADSMHELRYFNQRLKNLSEELSKGVNTNKIGYNTPFSFSGQHADNIRGLAESILSLSQMFTTRLDFIEVELNPCILEAMPVENVNIYGKFDKSRRMLNSLTRNKKVKIKLDCDHKLKLVQAYSIVDILPYLLLDNAVKYTPERGEVDVSIVEYKENIEVTIESFGPYVGSDELSKITEKHFRGRNAKLLDTAVGKGLGLYYCKFICDIHGYGLSFESEKWNLEVGGLPHSTFTVKLSIPLEP